MEITEVRIKLMEESGERLRAFCSITLDDCFVIRDLKIIDGTNGLFVAMPSRKLASRCPQCGYKNHLRSAYCNQCGLRLKDDRAAKDENGRAKLYADIAHPINSRCRERVQQRIVEAYYQELERSKLPGYVSSYDDMEHEFEDGGEEFTHGPTSGAAAHAAHPPAAPHALPARSSAAQPVAAQSNTVPPDTVKPVAGQPARTSAVPQGPHKPPATSAHPTASREGTFGSGVFD